MARRLKPLRSTPPDVPAALSFYPKTNPALKIYCCDFAASAVELVRQNPQYSACGGAIQAFVADITSDMLARPQSEGGCGVPEGG